MLKEDNPAKKHLRDTINHLKKEVEDLKAEKAKSKPAQGRKYSARQESDKKVVGARVAFIKEKQRRRAAKARAEGVKERAKRKLANEEAYENEFNQEGQGRKRQTYPLSTGRFAEDKEAVPLTRKEKSFRKEEGDEDLEVKERSMRLPESEIRRQKTKRQREKRKKEPKRPRRKEREKRKPKSMRMKRNQRKIRRRRKRKRKRRRKKGAKLVAVLFQHARVLPSTHLREGWVVRLLRMRRKENFIDLKLQRKFHDPRMDLKVRIGQGSILLSTLVPVILHCQLEFCQDIRLERSGDTRSFPWQMDVFCQAWVRRSCKWHFSVDVS